MPPANAVEHRLSVCVPSGVIIRWIVKSGQNARLAHRQYAYVPTSSGASRISSQALRRCSSVVRIFPRPIRITVCPHNLVCVRYARPEALIRSTMSLFDWSTLSAVAGVGDPGPASSMPATNRKQTTPMLTGAASSKRSSLLIQSASRFAKRICSRRRPACWWSTKPVSTRSTMSIRTSHLRRSPPTRR